MPVASLRLVSARVFGNEKFAEVVCALAAESNVATAQQIAIRTGINHSLVRDVLIRLADAGILTPLPRATTRAAQYYQPRTDDRLWVPLVALAKIISDQHMAAPVDEVQASGQPDLPGNG